MKLQDVLTVLLEKNVIINLDKIMHLYNFHKKLLIISQILVAILCV